MLQSDCWKFPWRPTHGKVNWWIQTRVTVRKRLIWIKIDDFFKPCGLELWRMTFKNNREPLLCSFKLCVSFRSHWWIQTRVTVRKRVRPIWVKFWRFLEPCDLEIWRMTFKNNRAPLLWYFELCASFRSHWWIQTGVTVRGVTIRRATIRYVLRYVGRDTTNDMISDDTPTNLECQTHFS